MEQIYRRDGRHGRADLAYKGRAFFLCPPGKKLGYTFPVLKYPAFYALRAGDNIFICKSHLSMDLSNPMHAGQWDPDKLPATGGTDDYFIDFLLDQLECRVPGIVDSGLVSSWLSYRAEPKDFLPILGRDTGGGLYPGNRLRRERRYRGTCRQQRP